MPLLSAEEEAFLQTGPELLDEYLIDESLSHVRR